MLPIGQRLLGALPCAAQQLPLNLRGLTATRYPTGPIARPAADATRHPRSGHRRRGPGHTCLSALGAGGDGSPQQPINDSKGCGGVMRIAPIGWLAPGTAPARFALAARAAALTHGHPDGWLSAGMLAALINALFAGQGLRHALAEAKALSEAQRARHAVRADLLAVVARAETAAQTAPHDPERAIAALGQGWVGEEALAIALYAVLSASGFEDAVRRAANHDGDSDSTAAIAGQIWGAWKGIDSLPMRWVRRLDVLPECLHGVAQLAGQGHTAAPTGKRHPYGRASSMDAQGEAASEPSAIDFDAIDLRRLSLYEESDRIRALTAFYHQGDAALMPFTTTVWDSLLEPKTPKVAQMAQAVGIAGSDRLALRKMLAAYLEQTQAAIDAVGYPRTHQGRHTRSEPDASLNEIDAVLETHARRWARLLNGEPMAPEGTLPEAAQVIKGRGCAIRHCAVTDRLGG